MFPIISCSINIIVTSQNDVPSFHMHHLYMPVLYTLKRSHISVVYCVEVIENGNMMTQMQIDST